MAVAHQDFSAARFSTAGQGDAVERAIAKTGNASTDNAVPSTENESGPSGRSLAADAQDHAAAREPFACCRLSQRNIAPIPLVTRLNAGAVVPAPPKITPPAIFTEDVLADEVQPPPEPKWLADLLRDYPWLPWATLGLALLILILLFLLAPAFPLAVLGGAVVLGLGVLFWRMLAIARALAQPQIFQPSGQTPAAVDQAPMSSDFRITEPEETFRPSIGTSDNVEAVRFKTALRDMYTVTLRRLPPLSSHLNKL